MYLIVTVAKDPEQEKPHSDPLAEEKRNIVVVFRMAMEHRDFNSDWIL